MRHHIVVMPYRILLVLLLGAAVFAEAPDSAAPGGDGRPPDVRLWERTLLGVRLCRIEGRVKLPQGSQLDQTFSLSAKYTYLRDVSTNRWLSVEMPGAQKCTNTTGVTVGPDGTFELLVPQASTVTFWRVYDLREPRVPYVVPPTVVQIPLGKATLRAELQATVPQGADRLFTFKGRVLSAETDEPVAGLWIRLQCFAPGVDPDAPRRPRGMPPRKPQGATDEETADQSPPAANGVSAEAGKAPIPDRTEIGIQHATADSDGNFTFEVPRLVGYRWRLYANAPRSDSARWIVWANEHPRPMAEVADIFAHETDPFIWRIAARKPLLFLEYQTTNGDPAPLPEGKTLARAHLRIMEPPKDRTVRLPDGTMVEHRYKATGRSTQGGEPEFALTTLIHYPDGRVGTEHTQTTIRWEDVYAYSNIQKTPEGRLVQKFYKLPQPGRFKILIESGEVAWKPVEEDAIINFRPQEGETVHKVIRVEPRTDKAPSPPDTRP